MGNATYFSVLVSIGQQTTAKSLILTQIMDILAILLEPMFWIGLLLIGLFALYRYGTSTFHIFSEQGIPGPTPLPFIGNLWGFWKQNLMDEDMKRMKKYGKVFGIFEGLLPAFYISDPEIIKRILVKDFDHFVNHPSFGALGPVLRKMVFFLEDKEWKKVRSSFTPAFTSGKIKKVSGIIQEHADKKAKKLAIEAKNGLEVDAKRIFSEITLGIIGQAAFGIKFDDLGENNLFFESAMNLFGGVFENQTATTLLPIVLPSLFPVEIISQSALSVFIDMLQNVIRQRSKAQEKYNDYLDILSEILSEASTEENGKQMKTWSGEELEELICGQALEFLIDGYESTSQTTTLLAYEMAMNPEIQAKLHEEIMQKLDTFGQVSHEMVQEMSYLEQIINEVLRLHPILARIDRECCKDFSFNGFVIKKGMKIQIPVYAMHRSEEFFPDPDTFNPDRWSPENKSQINTYTYLPFGGGPRGCLGSRFAMEQMKIIVCTMISQFEFYPVEKTPAKMKFKDGFSIVIQPIGTTIGIRTRQ